MEFLNSNFYYYQLFKQFRNHFYLKAQRLVVFTQLAVVVELEAVESLVSNCAHIAHVFVVHFRKSCERNLLRIVLHDAAKVFKALRSVCFSSEDPERVHVVRLFLAQNELQDLLVDAGDEDRWNDRSFRSCLLFNDELDDLHRGLVLLQLENILKGREEIVFDSAKKKM